MIWWLALLNAAAAAVSVFFGVAAAVRPQRFGPSAAADGTGRFYAIMYAVRAVPLGLAVILALWLVPTSAVTVVLLLLAAVVQLADAVVGIIHRNWGMVAGALFAVLVHVAGVFAVSSAIFSW